MEARWIQKAGNAFLLVLCVLLFQRTLKNLSYFPNWDLLGYMGLALEWELDDQNEVHRRTYETAKAELPGEVFRNLTAPQGEVRLRRYREPEIFTEHISFYRARVLPTYLMHVMNVAGAPLSRTLWWIGRAALVLTALLMLVWLARYVPFWVALLSATLLAHAPPLLATTVLATPDGLGTLLMCAGVWALIEHPRRLGWHIAGATLLALCILTRPDAILFVGALILLLAWGERGGPRSFSHVFLGGWLALSVVLYLGVGAYAAGYGWWPLFHISFVQKELHPAALPTSLDLGVYREVLGRALEKLPGEGYFKNGQRVTGSSLVFVYAAFAGLALAVLRRSAGPRRCVAQVAVLQALLATYLVRWLLFPQLWDRFFAPLYVLVPLVILSMFMEVNGRDGTPEPSESPEGLQGSDDVGLVGSGQTVEER